MRCAFVGFVSEEEAKTALEASANLQFNIKKLTVDYDFKQV